MLIAFSFPSWWEESAHSWVVVVVFVLFFLFAYVWTGFCFTEFFSINVII